MSDEYKITSQAFPDGLIKQELQQIINKRVEVLSRWIMNTRDEGIWAALIDLGWTPPSENPTRKR